MTALDIIKALVLGFCVSVPFGPVAILVIQNTVSKGRRSGFVTGLGATVVDSTWATVCVFAIGMARHLLDVYGTQVQAVGGVILIPIGVMMALANPFRTLDRKEHHLQDRVSPKDFIKSLTMGYSNPGAILIMFALFTALGINVSPADGYKVVFIIVAVAAGSISYWALFSGILSRLRRAFKPAVVLWINRTTGVAVVVFGLWFLVSSLMKIIR